MLPSYRGNRPISPTGRGRLIAKAAKRAVFPQLYTRGQDESIAIGLLLLHAAAHGQLWTAQLERLPGDCCVPGKMGHSAGAALATERVFAMGHSDNTELY